MCYSGQEYPVHPLDVVSFSTSLGLAELDGITLLANASLCTNHFFSGDPDPDNSYDILLGMGFLRNVYASYVHSTPVLLRASILTHFVCRFQYGDYTPPGINMTGQLPYVQLLSVTDKDAAWAEYYEYYQQKVVAGPPEPAPSVWPQFFTDFNNLGGDDSDSDSGDNSTSTASSTGSASAGGAPGTGVTSGPTSVATSSPADSTDESQNLVAGFAAEDSSSGSKDSGNSKYGGIALGLLAANVAVGLAVLVVTLTLCIRGAREKREARYKPLRLPKEDGSVDPERAVLYTD